MSLCTRRLPVAVALLALGGALGGVRLGERGRRERPRAPGQGPSGRRRPGVHGDGRGGGRGPGVALIATGGALLPRRKHAAPR
jgi:hypothetical protein